MNGTKILAAFSKAGRMHSVAAAQGIAQELGRMLAPEMPAKVRYDRIYRRLTCMLPGISLRRVRALHNGEVRRVNYEEMRALEELRADEELRSARRNIAASAVLLAAHYSETGQTLARDEMLEIGRRHGAVDLSRNGGAAR